VALTLFHDYTSPAAAVAVARVQRLADEGVEVEFVGFEAIGLDVALPPPLDILMAVDSLQDEAEAEGLVLNRPIKTPPTAKAHAVAEIAEQHELGASWRQRCYRAYWADGASIDDDTILVDLAKDAGLPGDEVAEKLQRPGFVADVRRKAATHRRNGVGGVPTLLVQRTLVPGMLSEEQLRELAAY
jgi:predicted DsbA family dithiol-disulfide isomerase